MTPKQIKEIKEMIRILKSPRFKIKYIENIDFDFELLQLMQKKLYDKIKTIPI
jgi:hypothetical protein